MLRLLGMKKLGGSTMGYQRISVEQNLRISGSQVVAHFDHAVHHGGLLVLGPK